MSNPPGDAVPAVANGVRFDALRSARVVLAPERLFLPDQAPVELLKLADGARRLGQIDAPADRFDARRAVPAADAAAMMNERTEEGATRL
jgi:pyrroloquinoline quinone biosynthesis protein D